MELQRDVESFWMRMQVELLNRKRWNTRIELANAMSEYPEIWHNRRRRHSALGWLSSLEFENRNKIVPYRGTTTCRGGHRASADLTKL
jgi:transposase InsO family protein